MSNPRPQTNPAVHLLFVKAITDKLWKDHERYILFYLSKYESITLILLIQEEELFIVVAIFENLGHTDIMCRTVQKSYHTPAILARV
jgi:hypothetical protein